MKTNTKTIFNKLKTTLLRSGYEVILVSKLMPKKSGALSRGVKGYIVPDELRIYISKAMGINDRVITLIHELLHELYPQWSEVKVEQECKSIFRGLRVSQLGWLQFFVMTKAEMQSALKQLETHSPIC
jgi:hypothetical protein